MTHPLLKAALAKGAPLTDSERAVFLWQGEQPPYLVGDFNDWDPDYAAPWTPVEGGLWSYKLDLASDAYMEYAFLSEPHLLARIPDPFNARTVPDGLGHINHFFYMPDGGPTPLAHRDRGVPQGRLSRYRIESRWWLADGKRWVHLYAPPVDTAVPLIVAFDGQDYLRRGRLTHVVDNLIGQRRIQPVALALIEHGDPARGVEYSCNEATVALLMTEVLPLAQKHLNLVSPDEQPGAYGVLGASLSGLMALYTGLRAPHVFGRVLAQSGAFELAESETVVSALVRHMPVQPLKVWMDVGRYEWLLEANRKMHALLEDRGYDVTFREHHGSHNYTSWLNDVWRGLEVLFGP